MPSALAVWALGGVQELADTTLLERVAKLNRPPQGKIKTTVNMSGLLRPADLRRLERSVETPRDVPEAISGSQRAGRSYPIDVRQDQAE